MSFWAYLIQCADRHFYAGHTDDLERRIGEHQLGTVQGYTRTRRPVHLVWSEEFPSRYEALQAERQIKGWGRAKKLALIRGDRNLISALSRSTEKEGRASTGSARTKWVDCSGALFLHPHPARLPSEPFSLEAKVSREGDRLRARFLVVGPVESLRVPAHATAARRDNLWQRTCFETFAQKGSSYAEFNLSPSGEWAAYAFRGYREGMAKLATEPPSIRVTRTPKRLQLTAEMVLPPNTTRLGLSAVIEEKSGTKSYWALQHPPGDKPDFHHPDCFALELPPASGS